MQPWLGLDIGGANLKFALPDGTMRSVGFPLWKHPDQLRPALAGVIRGMSIQTGVAVTMTGELCDCFRTKADGVQAILSAVEQAAQGRTVRVYLTDGRFVPPNIARTEPLLAAASNWHALTTFVGRFVRQHSQALLIDVGSTTSDLIPLSFGKPATIGKTDPERLANSELVYTGVVRSPVACLVRELPWRGQRCPVAQEFFATTRDAYLLLGWLAEEPQNCETADGRPAVCKFAHDRLARMICADRTMFSLADAQQAAVQIYHAQFELLQEAIATQYAGFSTACSAVLTSGQGEFLANRLVDSFAPEAERLSLQAILGPAVSQAAPAYAVAQLAGEGAGNRAEA